MSTPTAFMIPSPFAALNKTAMSPSPAASQLALGNVSGSVAQVEWRRHLAETEAMCVALDLEADAAFDATLNAFETSQRPDCIATFLNTLERLKQHLAASGIGGLKGLDPAAIPSAADLDLNALAQTRAQESGLAFAASQKRREGAMTIHDILSQPAKV